MLESLGVIHDLPATVILTDEVSRNSEVILLLRVPRRAWDAAQLAVVPGDPLNLRIDDGQELGRRPYHRL